MKTLFNTTDSDQLKRVTDWLLTMNTGMSSKAMLNCALGRPSTRDWPHDPADFNRCLLLLAAVPEVRGSFADIRLLGPQWERLIDHWDQVEQSFLDEVGLDWTKGHEAPKTYKLMRTIMGRDGRCC